MRFLGFSHCWYFTLFWGWLVSFGKRINENPPRFTRSVDGTRHALSRSLRRLGSIRHRWRNLNGFNGQRLGKLNNWLGKKWWKFQKTWHASWQSRGYKKGVAPEKSSWNYHEPQWKNTEFVVSSKGPPRLPEPPFSCVFAGSTQTVTPMVKLPARGNSSGGHLNKKTKGHNMTQLQTQQHENMHHSEKAKMTERKPLSVLSGQKLSSAGFNLHGSGMIIHLPLSDSPLLSWSCKVILAILHVLTANSTLTRPSKFHSVVDGPFIAGPFEVITPSHNRAIMNRGTDCIFPARTSTINHLVDSQSGNAWIGWWGRTRSCFWEDLFLKSLSPFPW